MTSNQSFWQRVRRTSLILGVTCLFFGSLVIVSQTVGATALLSTSQASNLDDHASQWGIFYDHGTATTTVIATATVRNFSTPSVDGSSLKISFINGKTPYVGIHAYRNLPPANTATTFDLNLSFYFPTATPIQALEFTMNTWVNNTRWEWALQWENIGLGTPPPQWRLWTGSTWQPIGVTQQLKAKTWHTLHLKGDIKGGLPNGQVHYISFSCDSLSVALGQRFPPVSLLGDKLAVAVQLDTDFHDDPYQVDIDKVTLRWS